MRSEEVELPSKTIAGHGVSILVPPSWDGRIEWLGPGYARIVHLASFPLPNQLKARGHQAERLLEADDVYLNLALDPELASPSPPEMRREQLVGEWEGKVHEAGMRATLQAKRGLQAWVTFGSPPTGTELEQVNTVLATLETSPN
jgi:hypothetical protein